MMQPWAVFDVDGTLFPPSSMEKSFIEHMLHHGAMPGGNIFYYLLVGGIQALQKNYVDGFKNNKHYLTGLPAPVITREAKKFVEKRIIPKLSPAGLKCIKDFRAAGYKILVMSGSPDFLTFPLSSFLQPDYTIAAILEIKNRCFTGKLSNIHPYGERKTQLLHELQNRLQIDYPKSIVFANHHADFHHMKLFDRAVVVNPTTKLRDLAEVQHWPVEIW